MEGCGGDVFGGVFGEGNAVWKVPGFENDVATGDEWAEALEDGIFAKHFLHCVCVDV